MWGAFFILPDLVLLFLNKDVYSKYREHLTPIDVDSLCDVPGDSSITDKSRVVELVMHVFNCFRSKRRSPGFDNPVVLASETPFTVNEVEALYDLFKKLSSSIIDDGLIHKEEFQLALFKNSSKQNLFADRMYDLFDVKCNGVIEFGEFVRSLSVFHPNAPEDDKVAFLFRLYDLRQTGYIEREEVKDMVMALLRENDVSLSDDVVQSIVEKTMMEADTKRDAKIDEEEWREFVKKNPSIIKIMTLSCLKEVTIQFPSFVLNTEVPDYIAG